LIVASRYTLQRETRDALRERLARGERQTEVDAVFASLTWDVERSVRSARLPLCIPPSPSYSQAASFVVARDTLDGWRQRDLVAGLLQTQTYTLVAPPVALASARVLEIADEEGFASWLAAKKRVPFASRFQARARWSL
jgi:hypothetical protein